MLLDQLERPRRVPAVHQNERLVAEHERRDQRRVDAGDVADRIGAQEHVVRTAARRGGDRAQLRKQRVVRVDDALRVGRGAARVREDVGLVRRDVRAREVGRCALGHIAERQAVVGDLLADDDDVLEIGEARTDLLHHREVVNAAPGVGNHEHLRARLTKDELDLFRLVDVDDRRDDDAERRACVIGEARLHPVRHLHREHVALAQAERVQRTGELQAALVHLPERELGGTVGRRHDEPPVGERHGAAFLEHIVERARAPQTARAVLAEELRAHLLARESLLDHRAAILRMSRLAGEN